MKGCLIMDGAIFSFNNLFIDSDKLAFAAWQKFAMYEFGMGLPGKLATHFHQLSPAEGLAIVLKHFHAAPDDAEQAEMKKEWTQMFANAVDDLNEQDQQPGIKRLLLNLYDHYVKIAVLDPTGEGKVILNQIGLDNYIDLLVSPTDEENPYAAALTQMALTGKQCIGIGTTAQELAAIHKTDAVAIGVGDAATLANADYQVVQVGDLRYPMLQKIWEDKQK